MSRGKPIPINPPKFTIEIVENGFIMDKTTLNEVGRPNYLAKTYVFESASDLAKFLEEQLNEFWDQDSKDAATLADTAKVPDEDIDLPF
jgi:hypothetical protein